MKPKAEKIHTEMRPEYELDYSKAVRGKYFHRLMKEGANVIVLEPDLAKAFPTSAAVNDALRSLLKVSEITRRLTTRPGRRPAVPRDVARRQTGQGGRQPTQG